MSMDISELGDVETDDPLLSPHMHLEGVEIVVPVIGMEFDTDEIAKQYYIAYASRVGFGVRMNKSRRSRRDDTVIMRRFVCTREGFHSKRVIYDDGKKKRKRGTTREGCMAMIEVIKKDYGKWVVTKLVTEHTHLVMFPSNNASNCHGDDPSQTDSMVVFGDCSGGFNNLKNFTRGIRVNPFGEGGEAQDLLEYLKRMQAENPGFFYALQVDNNNCMTNVFWADAKARTSYAYFGDAIIFDTTYKKTKYMMPFATFRGVNHHLQSVTFGAALLMDETKGSYVWLFETWLSAMGGRLPSVLVTDRDKAMEGAIGRIFPNTNHQFCKFHILSRCKQKLSDVYLKHASFNRELRDCVNEPQTPEDFETCWQSIISRYGIWDNQWLKSLYEIRERWVPVYLKNSFFPKLSENQRSEDSLNKFFKRNFNTKTSLLAFVTKFEQTLMSQYEEEAQADCMAVYSKPSLRTPSLIEKHAADVYTSVVFEKFQTEFVESLGYYAEKIEDGVIGKYHVIKEEGPTKIHVVSFNESDRRLHCSCCKFESSGLLCRHVLRVFFIVGIHVLPDEYILKRWTRNAMTGPSLNENTDDPSLSFHECLVTWYNDLCHDAIKYGVEGATSVETYNAAKVALEKAFSDVIEAKSVQKKTQQNVQRLSRMQKLQNKMPLPKLNHKKNMARVNEDTIRNLKIDPV